MPAQVGHGIASGGRGVGVFLHTERNDYQKLQEHDALAVARRLAVPLSLWFADGHAATQVQQIEAFLASHRPDSVIIVEAVEDGALAAVAARAVRAGAAWFLLNRTVAYMEDLRRELPGHALCIVSADQTEIGRIQGRQFRALLRGPKTMLYVQGPKGSSSTIDRLAGVTEILAGSEVRYELGQGDGWTEASGEKVMSHWLHAAGPGFELDLVGCQNDQIAAGVVRALTRVAARLNRPELALTPVTGVDGNPHFGRALVDQGRFTATVIMPAGAGRAIELAHDWWHTGRVPPALMPLAVRSYPDLEALPWRVGH
jgi:ABC-type sugar transport system substrate-binding protein